MTLMIWILVFYWFLSSCCQPCLALSSDSTKDGTHNNDNNKNYYTHSTIGGSNEITSQSSNYWRDLSSTRIVGGDDADPDRFPYFVMLLNRNRFVCGGTLIAPDIVLTAAHCDLDLIRALVGKYTRDENELEQAEDIEIERAIPHPNFDYNNARNDIMLLKLRTPSTKPYVNINLNADAPVPFVDTVTIIGLGRTEFRGSSASILQEVDMMTIPNDECDKSKGPDFDYKGRITDDMICLVGGGDLGQCNGDSGGPYLMLGESYEDDLQVGVVSWGVRCAHETYPGVGSRLSASSEFIQIETCFASSDPPPLLCGGIVSESPTGESSFSPSEAPSLESSRNCKAYFEICSTHSDCCSNRCLNSICRTQAGNTQKTSIGRGNGTRGGAASRVRGSN